MPIVARSSLPRFGELRSQGEQILVVERALGDGVKRVYESERAAMTKLRRVG